MRLEKLRKRHIFEHFFLKASRDRSQRSGTKPFSPTTPTATTSTTTRRGRSWNQIRLRRFHFLLNFGRKSQFLRRLEHHFGVFRGHFDWSLFDAHFLGHVTKGITCPSIFHCIWFGILFLDPFDYHSFCRRIVSEPNIYVA